MPLRSASLPPGHQRKRTCRSGRECSSQAEESQDAANLVVPSITIFEVFERIRMQRDSEIALRAVSQMRRGTVVDLDADLAIAAADLSADLKTPAARQQAKMPGDHLRRCARREVGVVDPQIRLEREVPA